MRTEGEPFLKRKLQSGGEQLKAAGLAVFSAAGIIGLVLSWYYSDERVALRTIPKADFKMEDVFPTSFSSTKM